jgi:hypothetical protein
MSLLASIAEITWEPLIIIHADARRPGSLGLAH